MNEYQELYIYGDSTNSSKYIRAESATLLAFRIRCLGVSFQQIDPEALRQLCAGGDCSLVDVRSAPEVQRGYIGGALHIPLPSLPQRLDALDRARPVVVYCQSGGRSAQACAFLAANGYPDLYNLQGGIIAWMRAGFAVET